MFCVWLVSVTAYVVDVVDGDSAVDVVDYVYFDCAIAFVVNVDVDVVVDVLVDAEFADDAHGVVSDAGDDVDVAVYVGCGR